MKASVPEVDSLDIELGRLEKNILEVLHKQGPLQISDVASELNEDHEKVRRAMNKLSRKHLVASLPGFEYEYVGEQTQRRPA